ncbi:MAG TPA: hypothetical protein VF382_06425 [Actinomycetota bacterium]
MSQRGSGFDMSGMSTASKILLAGGFLYFVDMLLKWNKVCFLGVCPGVNGWEGGLGLLDGLLVIVIIAVEVLALLKVDLLTPQLRSMISAGAAGLLLVFTLLKVLIVDNDFLAWPAWLGIILAFVIAYGGWMRWQEGSVSSSGSTGGGIG